MLAHVLEVGINDYALDVVDNGKTILGFVKKPRGGSWSVPETNCNICSSVILPCFPPAAFHVYVENAAYASFSNDRALQPSSENTGVSMCNNFLLVNAVFEGRKR